MDRQLLARATENSDAPTPGYMYLDIAKNAASNPATCADIAKYLTNRLASKNNHNIKYKCLKVISKTCTSPYLRGQFKRCLAQDPNAMSAIKEALQYRGPPDPVRGDEPSERVRTAAKEALDAVYSDIPADSGASGAGTNSMYANNSLSSTSNYGQSAHGAAAGPPGGGPRRMEGIGNPMFKDPRLEPQTPGIANMSINDVMKEAKETVIGMIKDPLAKNVTVGTHNNPPLQVGNMPRPGGWQGANPNVGSYSGPPGRNELMHQTGGQWTMASNRGPDAVTTPPNYGYDASYYKSRDSGGNAYSWAQKNSAASGGVGGSWAASSPPPAATSQPAYNATPSITVNSVPTAPGVVSATGGGGTAVADGSYEKQLVMELCPPGGMKAEPPPDKLAQFSRTVASLNSDLVCPVLLDCLEEGQPWIIRAKALWVIESCIRNGQRPDGSANPYTDFFHACQGEIAPLVNHTRAAVRDPAKRVLGLLGVATPVPGSVPHPSSAAPPAAAPPSQAANLLDFDSDVAPAPAPAVPPPAPAGTNSLFGGLNIAGGGGPPVAAPPVAAPPGAAPRNTDLLGDLGGDVPFAAPVSGGSLFGDMTVKDTTPAPSSAAPANTGASAMASQAASLFDNMSLKTDASVPTPQSPAPAAPAGGSAFGFINQSSSTDNSDTKPAEGAATVPSPAAMSMDSFDPLKNMTPNTAKKAMQISPEQMQAMAYQQMMMQQQMQMMMAMQMQQKRGSASGGGFRPMQGNNVMQNPAAAKTSFAFMDKPKANDKSFDFVKDAISKETKK